MFVETTERDESSYSPVFSGDPEHHQNLFCSSPQYSSRVVDPSTEFFPHLERMDSFQPNYLKDTAGLGLSCADTGVRPCPGPSSLQSQDSKVKGFRSSSSPIPTNNYIIPDADLSDEFSHLENSLEKMYERTPESR